MDRLKEVLHNIWIKIVELLKNFENSSLFERIMRRYESMTPRGQNGFKLVLKLAACVFVGFIILGGPFMLLSKINRIRDLESLEGKALLFQSEFEAQTRGYNPPDGWRPMGASSANELASTLNDYLPGIGVPEEFGVMQANGDNLTLTLKEISIRQATGIMFQLEGLYPRVRTQSFEAKPNAGQRDIIDMNATFQFNPAFAGQVSALPGKGTADEDIVDEIPPANIRNPKKSGTTGTNTNGQPVSPNSPTGGDFVPPPPAGDFDEMAPPEIPEDLPPPPPPPGFEEEPQQ